MEKLSIYDWKRYAIHEINNIADEYKNIGKPTEFSTLERPVNYCRHSAVFSETATSKHSRKK